MTTQVLVEGWRYSVNDENYTIKYNNDLVSTTIHVSTDSNYTTTYTELGYEALKDTARNVDLRPIMPMTYVDRYGNCIGIKDDSFIFFIQLIIYPLRLMLLDYEPRRVQIMMLVIMIKWLNSNYMTSQVLMLQHPGKPMVK